MATTLERAQWCENEAGHLAGIYHYVFGGGHGVAPVVGATFPPTKGLDPEGTNPRGYDCSGWAGSCLWHAGMLGSGSITNTRLCPGTRELAGWGEPGRGKYVTLWVRNSGGVEHCFLEFHLPDQPKRWSAGAHTGTICGWQPYGNSYDPAAAGYLPRHYPGG